jgi:DeoR family suf operon transcriptional repressor
MEAQMHPAFDSLPRTRRQILWHLKRSGQADAEGIAASVGITASGARQHLSTLESDGLLTHGEQREGPGRPRFVYRLTQRADDLFPRSYAALANDLIACLGEEDPQLLTRLMEKSTSRRLQGIAPQYPALPLAEKIDAIAQLFDHQGFLVDVQRRADGSFLIVEHNCAVLSVALQHGQVCTSELALLQRLLPEATVRRVSHIVGGEHACAYEVEPRDAAAAAPGDGSARS